MIYLVIIVKVAATPRTILLEAREWYIFEVDDAGATGL